VVALKEVHSKDYIHKNLNCKKIFVKESPQGIILKLSSFKNTNKNANQRIERTFDNEMYLAPEVLMRKGYGQAADIWALGVVLFELAALVVPFSEAEGCVIEDEIK